MGIYSKEVFGGENTTPAIVTDSIDASRFTAAVAKTILQGYLAFSAETGTIKSSQEACQFVSNFTKELIDNGDLSSSDLDELTGWANSHAGIFSGNRASAEKKLVNKILANCTDTMNCPELEEVQKLEAQLKAAKLKAVAKFSPTIGQEVMQFVNRYGRSFDQRYTQTWTNIFDSTSNH